jgi:hypothetical protein
VAPLAALLAALGALALRAQGPDEAWRTVETAHFRVHFPAAAEAWSARLAARLEAVRAAVADEVGYAPLAMVDVVVADPVAEANGSAWPLLTRPRMVLWTTPPSAASALGQGPDWGELVAVHEYAHLAHLLRPSRHPLRAALERTLWPIGPLALGAPRWASEGYATLLEGRLTGSGRPASAWRAAVLRQWARQGRLPDYRRLAADRDGFLGMSMAYFAGSAFLEWLERRPDGAGSLSRLWAAATARTPRDFDAAFERVFGAPPAALWARFAAETTAAALATERRLEPSFREGETWLDRSGGTAKLAFSPDGRLLAALVADRRRPARLVVWSLEDAVPGDPGALASGDPEDPVAAPAPPRHRRERSALEARPGTRLEGARFLPGGDALLIGLLAPDRRGFRRADLARWELGSGRLTRLTRGADVRDADPAPGGHLAYGVRWRHGRSGLAAVELATGVVTELTAPALDVVHDAPRVAPDGRALAWLEHRAGRWRALLAALDAGGALGPARELEVEAGGEPLELAWRGDGSLLYAAVARASELEIEALPAAPGARAHQVTRSAGAALSPAPTPDGATLFYLALDADGLDLRRLPLDAATLQLDAVPAPPSSGAPPPAPVLAVEAPAAARDYRLGRAEWTPLAGGWVGSEPGALEAGARAGDLVGRWELVALGAVGGGPATPGAALRLTARPWPATVSLQLARFEEADDTHLAVELAARGEVALDSARLELEGGAGLDWVSRAGVPDARRGVAFARADLAGGRALGRLRLGTRLGLDAAGGFGDAGFRHLGGVLGLDVATGKAGLALAWERRDARAGGDRALRLGGYPSSIVPLSARAGRVARAGLVESELSGDRLESARLRLRLDRLPVQLLSERHRVDGGDWLTLSGLELRYRLAPLPLVGLPAVELAAGAGRAGGAGTRAGTRWWLGLVFPPRPAAPAAPGIPRGSVSAPGVPALDSFP